MNSWSLTPERLRRAKIAYSTRRVRPELMTRVLLSPATPRAGDLVLAKVDKVGQHARVERPDGRKAMLLADDEIVVCYGNRYAPDQFEAEVPGDLGPCQLVAGGGVAAIALSRHGAMREPTAITPIGLVADRDGGRLNVGDWALPLLSVPERRPPTIAVAGTSMNSGKTTAAASLIRGLVRAGCKVGAAKVTGTGSGGDVWLMADSGAAPALDFTLAGHPSTYRLALPELEAILETLTAHLAAADVDAIVLEVADGVYQRETAALLASAAFRRQVHGVLFAAGEAVGAVAGVSRLRALGLEVLGATGVLTASPLAAREAAAALDVDVLDLAQLSDPERARGLLATCRPLSWQAA